MNLVGKKILSRSSGVSTTGQAVVVSTEDTVRHQMLSQRGNVLLCLTTYSGGGRGGMSILAFKAGRGLGGRLVVDTSRCIVASSRNMVYRGKGDILTMDAGMEDFDRTMEEMMASMEDFASDKYTGHWNELFDHNQCCDPVISIT